MLSGNFITMFNVNRQRDTLSEKPSIQKHLERKQEHTEKMSPVYICQNDKPMTSLALSTAHQVHTNLCQPHSLKGCHIFVINLSKTCHPQFQFFAVDGSQVTI